MKHFVPSANKFFLIKDQLREKYEYSEKKRMWMPEIIHSLDGDHGNRSVLYALQKVFPNMEMNRHQPGYANSKFFSSELSFIYS